MSKNGNIKISFNAPSVNLHPPRGCLCRTALFDGAAGSAFFAVILVVIFTVCAIYYMIFTRKGLSHPGSRYGKGFMVALSFMAALHICNIATHVSLHLAWGLCVVASSETN
ncbi:hypothetical protein ABBQ32_005816 [Trebouxia sp. C0010 RCD-2024]